MLLVNFFEYLTQDGAAAPLSRGYDVKLLRDKENSTEDKTGVRRAV